MGSLLLLAIVVVIGIPAIAIVALARTSGLRRLLDEEHLEHSRTVSAMQREIAGLRNSVERLSGRLEWREIVAPASPGESAAKASATARAVDEPAMPVAAADPVTEADIAPAIVESAATSGPPALETSQPFGFTPAAAFQVQPDLPSKSASIAEEQPVIAAGSIDSREPAEWLPISTAPPSPVAAMQADAGLAEQLHPSPTSPFSNYGNAADTPPRRSFAERLRSVLPLEEVLGMNLFAKIGMVLLVLGFAFLGRVALIAMGPAGKVALLLAASASLLGGGVWLERKERYRLIGRTGIGGGWALFFFTTYAMYHVAAMRILSSQTLDCLLLLGVAIAMVAHTLRYKSQLVTGLAFLLAFSTVALSQDTVYALAAGVILAIAIVAIALREGWYELEVFGILASFANHFYWLYKLYPGGAAGHPFPEFWPSAILLILYWSIFRVSYVVRKIAKPRDERISTVAALLNTSLLLAVMKFQSTRPELAFYALLGLGAIEFFLGQLPIVRKRRAAFILLTVLGTGLMLAAVPFRFSGNSIALLWMIAAEMLLVAGIVQLESLFRRLGLITGVLTGLLVVYESHGIVLLRQHSQHPLIQSGILLLTCSVFFYGNALFLCRKWRPLFAGFDGRLAAAHSYLGTATAFLGAWALFTADWTAVAWAVLMLGAALGARRLAGQPSDAKHLSIQTALFAFAVVVQSLLTNCHFGSSYPLHTWERFVTSPVLSLLFYLTSWALRGSEDLRVPLRIFSLWAGTSLLALWIWLDVAPMWIAPVWMGLALALLIASRRIRISSLCFQEHVLAALAAGQLVFVNLAIQPAGGSQIALYVPFLVCAAALYGVSRWCTLPDARYSRYAAWAHTCGATALLAALTWHESSQPWLAVVWAIFALALAAIDRIYKIEELPYQAHALAAMAVVRVVTINLSTIDKWHGVDLRMLTVSLVVAAMYSMTYLARIPKRLRDRELHHVYSWAASLLAAWLLGLELRPIGVAPGLALLGLALFEWGTLRQQRQLRLQAYAALTAAFVRIFFVNLAAARLPGEALSPALYTVAPMALIYFFIWAQLQARRETSDSPRFPIAEAMAYFGTGCLVALLYFQVNGEWIVFSWAALALALLAAALLLDKEVFLHQASLLLFAIVGQGVGHNVFSGSYFTAEGWRGNFAILSSTAAVLLGALPIAFPLQRRYADRPPSPWSVASRLVSYLALRRPEQLFFFGPAVLVTLAIFVKMDPGMVTLAWGIEGVLAVLLGIVASQRTYRIAGLLLLLLCVGKIVFRDAWHLTDRDRYITFIALGAALTLVSMLYNRFRESIRRLL